MASGEIFERHHQALHRYSHSITGNGHDAADAMLRSARAAGDSRRSRCVAGSTPIAHGRSFCLGEQLVTESWAELRYVATHEVATLEQFIALYVARNGRLTRYAEFPDLAPAFAACSVTDSDEISAGSHHRTREAAASDMESSGSAASSCPR